MKSKPVIAVIGPGAIGIYISNQFEKFGYDVYVIARKITLTEYTVNVNDFKQNYRPKLISDLTCKVDYLFIATKYHHLDNALKKIPSNFIKNSLIIPFINGFLHFNKIEKLLNHKNVIASMIGGINASKINNKVKVITSNFEIMLSSDKLELKKEVQDLNTLLNKIKLNSYVLDNESEVIWRKLSRLSIVSSLTAATQMPLGYVKKNKKWRKIMLALIDEMVQISLSNNYVTNKNKLLKKILSMPDNLTTSLQRDISKKQDSELDVIVGSVIDSGNLHNCKTENFQFIYNLINDKYSL